MNHLNNVKLNAAKIRFAQSKFSLCPNIAARKKRGKTCCSNKFQGHVSHYHELMSGFGLSTPNFKKVSKSDLFQTEMEDIQQHLSS